MLGALVAVKSLVDAAASLSLLPVPAAKAETALIYIEAAPTSAVTLHFNTLSLLHHYIEHHCHHSEQIVLTQKYLTDYFWNL